MSTAHLCCSTSTPQRLSVGARPFYWPKLQDFNTATAFANMCCCWLVLIALPAGSPVKQVLSGCPSLSLVGLSSTPRDRHCVHQLRRGPKLRIDQCHARSMISSRDIASIQRGSVDRTQNRLICAAWRSALKLVRKGAARVLKNSFRAVLPDMGCFALRKGDEPLSIFQMVRP